jgi:hypothetical protein
MKFSSLVLSAFALSITNALVPQKREASGIVALPLQKHKRSASASHRLSRRSGDFVAAYMNTNLLLTYAITVSIGTPPQQILMVLDTGSSDMVVDATSSTECNTAHPNSCDKFGSCKNTFFELVT